MKLIPSLIENELLAPRKLKPVYRSPVGLSSAMVWKCASSMSQDVYCLRAWPESYPYERLVHVCHLVDLASDAGLDFIPSYFRSRQDQVHVFAQNRYWELTQWKPGEPNYETEPSAAKLQSATGSLADLHRVWSSETRLVPSPAVGKRLRLMQEAIVESQTWGLSGLHYMAATEQQLALETQAHLECLGPILIPLLKEAANTHTPVQYVLRDIHAEHVLFVEEHVTGIIDFGAAGEDEVATDLARLIGSLEPFSAEQQTQALEFYQGRAGAPLDTQRIALLDASSVLLSAIQWLRWLVLEPHAFSQPRAKLVRRWKHLLERLSKQSFIAVDELPLRRLHL